MSDNKTENRIEESVSKTVSGNKILEVTVRRNNREGLSFTLKSPLDFSFLARPDKRIFNYHGVVCYNYLQTHLKHVNGRFLSDLGYWQYAEDGENFYPNLQLLLAKDINNGVTFNFGKMPLHESASEKFILAIKEQVTCLYTGYIAPINKRAIFTSILIDRAEIDT